MKVLYYSTVVSATDNRPKGVKVWWPDLVKKLSKPEIRGNANLKKYLTLTRGEKAKQKGGSAWIPAIFKKGALRNDKGLDRLYFFVGDCDNTKGHEITWTSLKDKLSEMEAVIHTTYSHSSPVPKFRFVVPLKIPVDRKRYVQLFNHFNNICGGALDPKGKTPSQLYYWPSCPPDAQALFKFFHSKRGLFFDPESVAISRVGKVKEVDISLPDELPEIDVEKLGLSDRIKKLIQTGKDPSNRYTSRSEALFGVVIALMSHGLPDTDVAGICMDSRHGISEKILEGKNPRKYLITTLLKARSMKYVGDTQSIDDVIAELNEKHAIVNVGGRTFIMSETIDPVLNRHSIDLGYERDIKLKYGNRRMVVNEKSICISDVWITHEDRRQYERIIFSPQYDVPNCYNLWRGFAVEPRQGDCDLYLNHVRENIANNDEAVYNHIIAFMADAVQNPASLPGVTLVMRGGEGTGKGVFATQFGALFGQHFIHVSNSRHLVGNFNAHLKDGLIVFADEALYAGDKSVQGVLNAMITEATRSIEYKGKDVITVPNYVRLIMASNHDWVVPAGPHARRFFVVDVSHAMQQNVKYFTAIRKQMENGGREALLHHLMNYDLKDVEIRRFPRTDALIDQQIRSMSAEQKFWMDRLRRGELLDRSGRWGGIVKCHTLHNEFIIFAQKSGYSRRSVETELGLALRLMCSELIRKRRRQSGVVMSRDETLDRGKKAYYYEFPQLKRCRELFEKYMKIDNINWNI